MQNVYHKREELHKLDENIQCKKFFCAYLGILFARFYIFISSGRRKEGHIVCNCVRF